MAANFTAIHNEMNRCLSQARKAGKRQSSASRFSPYGAKTTSSIPPPGLCENPCLSYKATREIEKAQEIREKSIRIDLLLRSLEAGVYIKKTLLELLLMFSIPKMYIEEYIGKVQKFLKSYKTHKNLANRLLKRFEAIERGELDFPSRFIPINIPTPSLSTTKAEKAAKKILAAKDDAEKMELIEGFVSDLRIDRCVKRKEKAQRKCQGVCKGAPARPDGPDSDIEDIEDEYDEVYHYEKPEDEDEDDYD